MTTSMIPPPPTSSATTDPQAKTSDESSPSSSLAPKKTSMVPAPPQSPNPSQPDSAQVHNTSLHEEPQSSTPQAGSKQTDNANNADSYTTTEDSRLGDVNKQQLLNSTVPYTIPPWSGPPCHHFSLEVLKDGAIIGQFDVNEKGAYMFGRVALSDFVVEHPTISQFHAVLQFKSNGDAYLYDLGSTHGTFINTNQVKKRVYVDLHVGDVIRFGHSSGLYIFQGPAELMPPEEDLKIFRKAMIWQEMQELEETLNESTQESIGTPTRRKSHDGKKGAEDDEEDLSNEDDFYGSTKKPSKQKGVENQSIEIAGSFPDQKDAIIEEIEDKKKLLLEDENKISSQCEVEAGDTLDACMSGLSSRPGMEERDELAESLNNLFTRVSTMVKGELQGTNNLLELLEKMNLRVAEEYKNFGDQASGLRVFVEQLKSKCGSFDKYIQQIDAIEKQVTEFEALISMLDKYVSLLESKVHSVYQNPPS